MCILLWCNPEVNDSIYTFGNELLQYIPDLNLKFHVVYSIVQIKAIKV